MKQKKWLLLLSVFVFICSAWAGEVKFDFDAYHTPEALNKALKKFAAANSKNAVIHKIALSPGGREVNLIEIGPEVKKKKKLLPAVFVAANMEGTVPISSEAAIYLIKAILEKPEVSKDKTWYVLPVGNPDAAAGYFKKPLVKDGRSDRPHNDDMDDQTDEDGCDDLDKNGFITQMRVKDPQGKWMPVPGEPRLMKKADWSKGEKGIYKLYSEGIDNDGDGKYNEDGPGGVNIGINFPHLFKYFSKDGGTWAGSEDESYNLIKFINERKEIAMVFTFGDSNFCKTPPRGGRKGSADFSKIKIPKRFGKWLNVDTERTYTMKEVKDIAKRFVPEGMEVTESMIASFFGLGAVVNPLAADLKFYNELAEKHKKFLKKNKLDGKRLDTAKAKDGSFELWAYYHLVLPSFSMDFWTAPELKKEKKKGDEITAEKLEKMDKDEFLALGEEKIAAFLKDAGVPKNFNAKKLMELVKSGVMTPEKMAGFMKNMPKPKSKEGADENEKSLLAFSDKELQGKGFVDWKPFNHPTLGKVEIGGFVPYADNTPPPAKIKELLAGQVPWVFNLVEAIPTVRIAKAKVKSLGGGLYRVEAWIANTAYLPIPTAMGDRNKRNAPIVVSLSGSNFKIIEGKKRTPISKLGSFGVKEVKWLLQAEQPVTVKITADSPQVRQVVKTIKLGGSQ
ncbi:MAG: hypothetical protein KAW12_22800 [Candidatus Aminicenantes bacterium]|nr:hypothetical protein [Candidatus Aminicenantes bacterium]